MPSDGEAAGSRVVTGGAVAPSFLRFRATEVEVRGRRHSLEWVDFPPVVAVLAFTEQGEMVLVRQYRAPVGRLTVEVPAGACHPGESAEEAARRELAEETGYRAARLEPILAFHPAIGYSSERITVYLATGLTLGEARPDEGEEIEVLLRNPAEVEEMIRRGEISDSKSLLAFHFWRADLRLPV